MRSAADFPTARGAQFLATMAKHFAHKITVETLDDRTIMHFPRGEAEMRADAGGLHLTVTADSAEDVAQTRDVVERHLLRFAHREDPAPLVWRDI